MSKATHHIKEELLNKKVSLNKRFNLFVVNALWQIVAGERFKYNDPKLNNLVAKIERMLNKLNQV